MNPIRSAIIFFLILALLFVLSPARGVRAAICTWTGAAANANWSTTGNWTGACTGPGGIPGTGDSPVFPNGGSNTTMTDDLPTITLGQLHFPGSTGYILNGANTITLTTGIDVSGGSQVINAPLAVATSSLVFTVASGASLSLGGTVALGTNTLTAQVDTAAGVTGLSFHGLVTGGPSSLNRGKIAKNGNGDLKFFGDDDAQNWDIDLNTGSVSTDNPDPNPGTYLPYSGLITLASGTQLNLLTHGGIGSIAGAGDIHASPSSFFQIRQWMTTTFTGDITGTQQMYIWTGGHLTIDRGGTLSYTGEIDVGNATTTVTLVDTDARAASFFAVSSQSVNSVLELKNSQVGLVKLGLSGQAYVFGGTLKVIGPTASSIDHVVVQDEHCTIESVMNFTTDYGQLNEAAPMDLAGHQVRFSFLGSATPQLGFNYQVIHNTNGGTAIKNGATFSGLPQGGLLPLNGGALAADYQASSNTAFTLTGTTGYFIYLPLILR